jgi:hypothetical protein
MKITLFDLHSKKLILIEKGSMRVAWSDLQNFMLIILSDTQEDSNGKCDQEKADEIPRSLFPARDS